MTDLTQQVLAKAKYKTARRIAVENFTFSASSDKDTNRANLALDTRLYNWNAATVGAIREILKASNKI